MTKLVSLTAAALLSLGVSGASAVAAEAGHEIERQHWSFGGFKGQFDQAQLQRGFQVFQDVCSNCHGLKRLSFRNLAEPGGPAFPEAAVKDFAASWKYPIPEMNDAGEVAGKDGQLLTRPAKPSDPILGPYLNDKQARAAQNGALPPDLSVIAKARNVHRDVHWLIHPFLMLGDIFRSYQEGGADYLFALLTGYVDAPADVKVNDGMYYNRAFSGHQLAMPPPLMDDVVKYQDGTKGTVENYARDVTAFLAWAADPSLNQRKRIGWQVMLYLFVTTFLLYLGKKRVWSKLH